MSVMVTLESSVEYVGPDCNAEADGTKLAMKIALDPGRIPITFAIVTSVVLRLLGRGRSLQRQEVAPAGSV